MVAALHGHMFNSGHTVVVLFSATGIYWEANNIDDLFSHVGSPCVCFRHRKLYTFL